ncbi:hypothetical protein [Chitinimonas sp. BJYL2]|uniref:hypothetical protein n=1 Tax=Chitinimonas sp. BJYL2 TaxID=2976696 RepID=UPI0022B566CA|nr:hypothetical protein [Chitinimonas sp. BJYL2]
MIFQHALATGRSALRGRLSQAFLLLSLLTLGVAVLAAAFSARQPQAVALDVGLSGIRMSLTLLSLIWVQDLVSKEIERRTVFFVFAYPSSRTEYLIGRYLGIMVMLVLALTVLGIMLNVLTRYSSWGYAYPHELQLGLPYLTTLMLMALDLALVTALALAVATAATTTMLPFLVGLAFAVAARALGPVLDFMAKGAGGDERFKQAWDGPVNLVRWLIPDLDRMDIRAWPLYGVVPDWTSVLTASFSVGAYLVALLVLAHYALQKREFA